jgi:hypothetical protein
MADHLRRQIRERIATVLTGLTTTAGRVYQTRLYPAADANLPGLTIYTLEEESEVQTLAEPRRLERRLQLMVEARAKATADLDDVLDGICKEVEIALGVAAALSSFAKEWNLSRTEMTFSAEGEIPVGVAAMQWTVIYSTAENAPDVVY